MGFKNFFHFLDGKKCDSQFLTCDTTSQEESEKPWLLVDFNNLFSISLQSGGHNFLGRFYCKEFLIALFTSNFRIVLFLDGECDSLRSLTKLERMVKDVVRIRSEDVTAETMSPEMV
jgi:hypothetical protein